MLNLKRTLVIDATGTPVDVVDWQKAIILVLTNKAKIIYAYDDVEIRSATAKHQLPQVLQLISRCKRKKVINFSRKAVFFRDNYSCGYCGTKCQPKELTFDHVIPLCQGGKTNWKNIISACFSCNLKKGGKTPDQARMPLLFKPMAPKWNPSFYIQLKKNDPLEIWELFVGQIKAEQLK